MQASKSFVRLEEYEWKIALFLLFRKKEHVFLRDQSLILYFKTHPPIQNSETVLNYFRV